MNRQAAAITAILLVAGCASTKPDITGNESQVAVRQIQTREYETLNKQMTMRSVVATLQDFGFVIDNADLDLGTVTATRAAGFPMRITVTVREKDQQNMLVRANARYGENAIEDPETYQDFFMALDKAMFLTVNRVD